MLHGTTEAEREVGLRAGGWKRWMNRGRSWLPTGRALPPEVWARRHRVIVAMLWGLTAVVPLWAVWRGFGVQHAAEETLAVMPFAILASWHHFPPRVRSVMASFGLLSASGVLVHLSGGLIELHFMFFIVVGIVTLYQDWRTYLLAVAFVALHHGVMGALDPHSVYNHYAAWNNPWKWAGIHAGFILAMSAVGIVAWKFNEELRDVIEVSEARFRGHFEHAAVGECMVTVDGTYVAVNAALCEMLGYTEAEMLGLNLDAVTHPDDRGRTRQQLELLVAGETESYDIDKRYVRRDGQVVHCLVSVSAIRDNDGTIEYTAGVIQDVSERKHAQDALEHQALHDSLTGLPNRSLLLDRVAHALAQAERPERYTALLFLDIDRFKAVNDSLGHGTGDDILIAVAARLQTTIRSGDTVARFGGDEFIVLCESLESEAEAGELAQRLLDELARPLSVDAWHFPLGASIGIAVAGPGDHITAGTLLTNADAAMYRAKERGRGRCEVFDIDMRARALERLQTENELRRAIDDRALVVHYQPLVSIASGDVVGVEALVRWNHPKRGLVPPAEFIPIAEELGLIVPLGAFVLEEACRTIAAWNRDNPSHQLGVSVNLSPKQVSTVGLSDTISGNLEASGLDPGRLCLEITETALLEDVAANTANLRALKLLGIQIAVDDFGTGYSSLSYLKRLPVDVLKIDRSFTQGVGTDSQDTAIVGTVIGLAHALGLHTVAEGVETLEQVDALTLLGCDEAQGFHWTPALPPEELERWLNASGGHAHEASLNLA